MRSPEFKSRQKKTGFIKKKSQESSEEEIFTNKDRYFRPSYHKYYQQNSYSENYRDQDIQKSWKCGFRRGSNQQNNYYDQKRLQESFASESSSLSDFDKFQLNSNITQSQYDFTKNINNKYGKYKQNIQSSFQLSPYKNQSSEKLQRSRNFQEIDSQNRQQYKQLKYRRNTIDQQSQQEQYSSLDIRKQKLKRKNKEYFEDHIPKYNFIKKQNRKNDTKNNIHQIHKKKQVNYSSETQSSGFSLDSQKFQEYGKKKENIQIKMPPLAKTFNKISESKHGKEHKKSQQIQKSKQINKSKQISTHSMNFQQHKQKKLQQSSNSNNSLEQNRESQIFSQQQEQEEVQLITEYDTKQFKGGSIKDRILDNYKNREEKSMPQKKIPHIIKQSEEKLLQKSIQLKKSKQEIRKKKQSKILKNQVQQYQQISQIKQKGLMFEIDVKKKNLTLAQAFQKNCTRLKKRLQNERQQFKKGNRVNQNNTINNNEDQQNDRRKINVVYRFQKKSQQKKQQIMNNIRKPQNNQKVERLSMGIKAPITKKQMYTMTLRNYKQLPEVKNKVNAQRKKQDLFRRMQNVKKLDRQVRLRLRYGQ